MKLIRELIASVALMASCAAATGDEDAAIVAARNIPPGAILAEQDLRIVGGGAAFVLAAVVGKEARRLIPEGASVHVSDVRAPTFVTRNGLVRMEFTKGPLTISTEGRALSGGAAGEIVKVMNIRSKTVVSAIIVAPGKVLVQ